MMCRAMRNEDSVSLEKGGGGEGSVLISRPPCCCFPPLQSCDPWSVVFAHMCENVELFREFKWNSVGSLVNGLSIITDIIQIYKTV